MMNKLIPILMILTMFLAACTAAPQIEIESETEYLDDGSDITGNVIAEPVPQKIECSEGEYEDDSCDNDCRPNEDCIKNDQCYICEAVCFTGLFHEDKTCGNTCGEFERCDGDANGCYNCVDILECPAEHYKDDPKCDEQCAEIACMKSDENDRCYFCENTNYIVPKEDKCLDINGDNRLDQCKDYNEDGMIDIAAIGSGDYTLVPLGNGLWELKIGSSQSCNEDSDDDGIDDCYDNCPHDYNPDQYDHDQNGMGDACE